MPRPRRKLEAVAVEDYQLAADLKKQIDGLRAGAAGATSTAAGITAVAVGATRVPAMVATG